MLSVFFPKVTGLKELVLTLNIITGHFVLKKKIGLFFIYLHPSSSVSVSSSVLSHKL